MSSRRFHVVMLAPRFLPSSGGVERFVYQVSKRLVKQGVQVDVLTVRHDPDLTSHDQIEGIDIHRFVPPSGWRVGGHRIPLTASLQQFSAIGDYWRMIRQADAIHCHDWGTFIYWYLPFRLVLFSKPIYVTFYGNEGVCPPSRPVVVLRRVAEWLSSDHVCGGDYIKEWYGTRCDKVVYGGVELPARMTQPENKNSAVYVGRLEPDTGVMTYLEVVRLLKHQHNLVLRLDVFGDGSLRPQIDGIVKEYGLDVRLHGHVAAANPSEFFAGSNYAFVSQNLAMLEAMVNWRLVYAVYDNPLKRDYVRSYPRADELLIASSSATEMVNKVLYFHANPDAAQTILNQAYAYASQMSWDRATQVHLEMYGLA